MMETLKLQKEVPPSDIGVYLIRSDHKLTTGYWNGDEWLNTGTFAPLSKYDDCASSWCTIPKEMNFIWDKYPEDKQLCLVHIEYKGEYCDYALAVWDQENYRFQMVYGFACWHREYEDWQLSKWLPIDLPAGMTIWSV
jgi:hypothetical protein